ncbi:FKBP-type peptidyl-prolyl cis-trans isomerase [Enteractinococcus coprophilus]|uniref:Peptidyl-prolyl cis-trans isomerase n=1 Tax=Enteractinococcus coprophilus TaxID=1027633 RepID=A0A543AJD7_9MICC|nr:FKBP-type peptidyl-prolyl cis-trans isomerase [Enteractinococcus coprophilus]TQL72682.1 peptidylprolyl isomerase [Enteractinococcus coprophilus]
MSAQHRRNRLATIAGTALTAALALTACGSDNDTDAEAKNQPAAKPDVEISYNISAETEEVNIDGELTGDEPVAWVIAEGDGDPIEEDDLLEVHSANIDIEKEEILGHDFDLGGMTLTMADLQSGNPQTYEAFLGAPVGSDVALYQPANGLYDGAPAILNIASLTEVLPTHATGEPVAESQLNDALPKVTLDEETQAPSIATPEGDAPEELVVDVLKQGDGREVQPDSKVTIQYRGVSWSNGEEFDSSWGPDNTGAPIAFDLQSLIDGWQEGLAGQKVDSQVLLSVPPELGYGGQDHELAEETLVFVIDVLHSADPMPAE